MTIADLVEQRQPFPVPVTVAPALIGMKNAIWDGKRIYLSPAMYALAQGSDQDALERLFRAIEVKYIPLPEPALTQIPFTPPAAAASPQN